MTGNHRLYECLRAIAGALMLGALFLAMPARTQTIENTADASWTLGGKQNTIRSNTVVLPHSRPAPAAIKTYHPDIGQGASTVYYPSLCNAGETNPITPTPGAAATVTLSPATSFRVGEQLIFSITSSLANRNAAAIDVLTVTLSSTAGDRERVTVFETSVDSGTFIGGIATRGIPPAIADDDCWLSVADNGDVSIVGTVAGSDTAIVTAGVNIAADPYGLVFDSETGAPVSGARVTLVDADTGRPATVLADDGVTPWPSSVISGAPVTDAGGVLTPMQPGEYRFPVAPVGRYRLIIDPPAPYTAPSAVGPEQLASLARANGMPFMISEASYGGTLALVSPTPVQVDIPLDRSAMGVTMTKTVSRPRAVPGDAVFYTVTIRNPDTIGRKRNVTVTDVPSQWLHLRADSVRIDGAATPDAITISPDGRTLTAVFDTIEPGGARTLTYAMVVRADAPAGQAMNHAEATDPRGAVVRASAVLRIDRDTIASRMTIIGRITAGDCAMLTDRIGIPGVRVLLEDGSFAVTDRDGRYHFEGVVPGTHVVQAQRQSLPDGGTFVDCSRSTRNAGSASSRFAIGQGGSLIVADFSALVAPDALTAAVTDARANEVTLTDREAAGGETDWFAAGNGPTDFLFPALDANPRAPAVRAVIRHPSDQTAVLRVDGRSVDPLSFDGTRKSPDGTYAVSIWRGIPLGGDVTRLEATVADRDGAVVQHLSRDVRFASAPASAELVPGQTRLIADGSTRPIVAVRFTDRKGNPIRAGVSGQVTLNAPYDSAAALASLQVNQLSGRGGATPSWTVQGDEGIALIELAPTMISGPLHLDFNFSDRETTRAQTLDAWVVPGAQEWTVVGLAEGSVGERTLADNMDRSGTFDSDLGNNARVALYAKGRVLGRYLLTIAYDSAKEQADQRLLGTLDPNAYYTVFADGSDRRFDAASREKLYVRIETATFYALYGDFVTGFDQTQLANYNRTATGVKAEGQFAGLHIQGFAAHFASTHRRDEIQGNGLTGPYRLSSRAIIANSERVTIEVRDRFRSEIIVSSRELTRFIDYDIDLLSGTIRFSEPVLSRDFDLNPQFIVIDYETDGLDRGGAWNGGARADYTTATGQLRVGGTVISDKGEGPRTDLAAIDMRARIGAATELRAEVGASRRQGATDMAWLVEAEHHTGNLDLLGYARSLDATYGVGQQNGAERGRRKFGFDARYNATEELSFTGSAWLDHSLTDATSRNAVQLRGLYRTDRTDIRLGITRFDDQRSDGTSARSTVLEGGATRRLFDNRLEFGATSSIALEGTDSIDLPARHRFDARYAVTRDIRLIGTYEIAAGDAIDARTLKAGIEVSPWSGGRVSTTFGQQSISEFGKRSFAAYGLAQSLQVSPSLSLSATLDGNRTLGEGDFGAIINVDQPVASGGQIGQDGELFEDFIAATLGASWRKDRWSATARGEYRDGQFANRKGLTVGAIRQLGEGRVAGAGFTWTRADGAGGTRSEIFDGAVSAAHRPANSAFAFLTKLEYRSDQVRGAIAGETGPAGRTILTVDGDAKSRRLIGSLSTNWSPQGRNEERLVQRSELALFLGGRYNFDRFQDFDLEGITALAGLDARVGIGERIEAGVTGTVRSNLTDRVTSFAVGPQIGFVPADGLLLTIGYNFAGFRDRDFAAARNTDEGLFAAIRVKFDADSFSFLSLGRQ